ncbi:hypothetical protein NMY22_g9549 [Coprinellus aureogranulatus]|nr:hypothetical protein NMY22_g9549 [Coprinellus aureogranulatus]
MSPHLRREKMLKITFSDQGIVLDTDKISSNRILHADDPTKFILLGVKRSFRFPDHPPKITTEYLVRFFKAGLFLNNVQYRFYHHNNSQLRERSCFLREANSDKELDDRIYAMGDFSKIMNASKRAKRIGLLFSSAQVDLRVDPKFIADIGDIEIGDEVFSDGCGLMSKRLAVTVAKQKGIVFRGVRYTPTVIQIRYLGYKGVLMLHTKMDVENRSRDGVAEHIHLAEFRKSMKKFKAVGDNSFSVVGYSKPYSFGRLNNDIVVLLSCLGVSNEKFLERQQQYFQWIQDAIVDVTSAVDFLSSTDKYPLAEKVFLDGLTEAHLREIKKLQMDELGRHHDKETNKFKTRMLIQKSRRLYGVCDPLQVLKEGQVHIRITTGRKGPSTPIHGDVLVVRNPCLHPVENSQLSHLVDCIVFATTAKPGHKAAPSMTSGGDLDGDEFFVLWDPDIVPTRTHESYDYPPNRERKSKVLTRMDLATYFASYNTSGVARVSALHNKWAISSPLGALCAECQELNALHSQSVDGAAIMIPERLKNPPEPTGPFIIDLLREQEEAFEANFLEQRANVVALREAEVEEPKVLLERFLKNKQALNALTEYEIFDFAFRFSRKYNFDLVPYLSLIDMSALGAMEKHAMSSALELSRIDYPYIWNSLFQSDILDSTDLNVHGLDSSFTLQKLYSSTEQSQATFFEYLRRATQDYTRKLLLMRTDERFAVGIFMRGNIPWDEEPEVNENVVVVSFLSESAITTPHRRPCTKGYRLHCSFSKLEIYNKLRSDTFVFIQRSPIGLQSEVVTSIALGKINSVVQRQLGRLNKGALSKIELHVVSNQDRAAHQLFDLWFEHVPTEEHLSRFPRKAEPYRQNDIRDIDWDPPFEPVESTELGIEPQRRIWQERVAQLTLIKGVFYPYPADLSAPAGKVRRQHDENTIERPLTNATIEDIDAILEFCIAYHADDELFLVFQHALRTRELSSDFICKFLGRAPTLAFVLLRVFPPTDEYYLHPEYRGNGDHTGYCPGHHTFRQRDAHCRFGCPGETGSVHSHPTVAGIHGSLMRIALSVRAKDMVQEVLLVLNDSRLNHLPQPLSNAQAYGHKHALNVVFDRAEEAADECPCTDDGRPRARQQTRPTQITLKFKDGPHSPFIVKGDIRVDAKHSIRLHSHVRFKATSKPDNRFLSTPVLDGLVIVANRGEYRFRLMQPAPQELEKMDWLIYNAGSIATSQAMLDALKTLMNDRGSCCGFYDIITGDDQAPPSSPGSDIDTDDVLQNKGKARAEDPEPDNTDDEQDEDKAQRPNLDEPFEIVLPTDSSLNESQMLAVRSWDARLSLIWGPPGTGKTTVVVDILRSILLTFKPKGKLPKIIMTASTHNAVDNVLERFIRINSRDKLLSEDQILRVATDQMKVNEDLHPYTLNDRVGGDLNQNRKLQKQAEARVKKAVMVFSTCAGAGLGILRKYDFDIAIIDEASQITEPCALIPFVKGVKKGIMVGDHVQLRPLVRKLGMALEGDVSLLERLYGREEEIPGLKKTMLDVQYRSPEALNAFPSTEFYQGRLKTSSHNEAKLDVLKRLSFPWPEVDSSIVPTVFIDCPDEEDFGGRSKTNEGQIRVILKAVELLKPSSPDDNAAPPSITILSPYRGQIQKIKARVPSSIPVATVDSFQGRESDIIIFSTVRANADGEIGFLEDHRRLNVMWTRARIALIIVGHQPTLTQNSELWKRAIAACRRPSNPRLFDPPPPPEE